MTDRPIIFSAPMVRALLDGRKSQTRRLIKPQPYTVEGVVFTWEGPKSAFLCGPQAVATNLLWHGAVPYATGDRLYVREHWRAEASYDETPPRDIEHDACNVLYIADGKWSDRDQMNAAGRFRQGMHMPRWASRLTLTVTDLRVQRLQGISAADSISEGIQCETCAAMGQSACHGAGCFASLVAFRDLWNSLHGPEAWGANPWVVALTFTVQHGNIDQIGGGS